MLELAANLQGYLNYAHANLRITSLNVYKWPEAWLPGQENYTSYVFAISWVQLWLVNVRRFTLCCDETDIVIMRIYMEMCMKAQCNSSLAEKCWRLKRNISACVCEMTSTYYVAMTPCNVFKAHQSFVWARTRCSTTYYLIRCISCNTCTSDLSYDVMFEHDKRYWAHKQLANGSSQSKSSMCTRACLLHWGPCLKHRGSVDQKVNISNKGSTLHYLLTWIK